MQWHYHCMYTGTSRKSGVNCMTWILNKLNFGGLSIMFNLEGLSILFNFRELSIILSSEGCPLYLISEDCPLY